MIPPDFLCPDDVKWHRYEFTPGEWAWSCQSVKHNRSFGFLERALIDTHPEVSSYWLTETLFEVIGR